MKIEGISSESVKFLTSGSKRADKTSLWLSKRAKRFSTAVKLFSNCPTLWLFSADKEVISNPAEQEMDYNEVWFDTKDEIPIHGRGSSSFTVMRPTFRTLSTFCDILMKWDFQHLYLTTEALAKVMGR